MTIIEESYAASLALIYRYQASEGQDILLSEESVFQYRDILSSILRQKGNIIVKYIDITDQDAIYKYSHDEKGNAYYILKSDFNLEIARSKYIGSQPLDIVLSSIENVALNTIGLQLVNGKIIKNNSNKIKKI